MSRDELVGRMARGESFEFLFFWGHTPKAPARVDASCLSQWFPRTFELEGERFATAEHFMMAGKARLFGDEETRALILEAGSPAEAKELGRKVRGFDESRWRVARSALVTRGNLAKFGQHADLRAFLLGTGDQVLVEASPRDTIWGIGLGAANPDARNPAAWRGLNLLGFALMAARHALRAP